MEQAPVAEQRTSKSMKTGAKGVLRVSHSVRIQPKIIGDYERSTTEPCMCGDRCRVQGRVWTGKVFQWYQGFVVDLFASSREVTLETSAPSPCLILPADFFMTCTERFCTKKV